ncbi:MAG: ABC transporter substrate-binding protein, partial [Clostridium sp.]
MKKIKKLIALAACGILATSLFTGCSKTASGSKDGEPVKLKWYAIGAEPKDLKLVQEEANKYLTDKINATIDMQFIDYGDYTQKMGVIINSGESFDLAFTCSWAGDYLGNARKGGFLELNDYLETTGKDMKEAIDQRFWDGATID